jgi:hypothetical protein
MQSQLNEVYEKYNVPHTVRNEINKLFALNGICKYNKGYSQQNNDRNNVEKWSNRN